jgi:ribosomal protein L23
MIRKVLNLRPITERKIGFEKTVHKFYNKPVFLCRSGKERPENTLCFSSSLELTKPELRQIFTKLYGLDVKRINTWNKQGKIHRNTTNGNYYRKKDIKRIILQLNTVVPTELQSYA